MSETVLTESEIDFLLSEGSGIAELQLMIKQEMETAVKPLKSQLNSVTNGIEDLIAKVTRTIKAKAFEDLTVGKFQSTSDWNTIKKIINNPEAAVRQLVNRLLNIEYSGKDIPVVFQKG